MMDNRAFEKRLVLQRRRARLSQLELAEKLNVSRQAISRWESGDCLPSIDNLICMSELYGVSVDYLLKGEDSGSIELDELPYEQITTSTKDVASRRHLLIPFVLLALLLITLFTYAFLFRRSVLSQSPVENLTGESIVILPEDTFTLD